MNTDAPIEKMGLVEGYDLPWRQQNRQQRNAKQETKDARITETAVQAHHHAEKGQWGRGYSGRADFGWTGWEARRAGPRAGRAFGPRDGRISGRTARGVDSLARGIGALAIHSDMKPAADESKESSRVVRPIHVIPNAHQDDIHGFLSISPKHFVSGSKDCALKMWDVDGTLVQELTPEVARANAHRGYKYWITSLANLTESTWVSGTRDGHITIWNQNGEEQLALRYNPSSEAKEKYVCKDRNKCRINCVTVAPDRQEGRYFYTGTPKYIQLWDRTTEKLINFYKASDNDWVYCIEVLENKDLLVVIGSDLDHWDMSSRTPARTKLIREEDAEHVAFQRPHISAITRLERDQNLLAAALFDGSVKVVDIAAQSLVRMYKEHQRRVWSVINLTPNLFASSADDRTIKIWDARQERSVNSFIGGPGRVSSLLKVTDTTFISGSCPDNVFASEEKANISFWDIRHL